MARWHSPRRSASDEPHLGAPGCGVKGKAAKLDSSSPLLVAIAVFTLRRMDRSKGAAIGILAFALAGCVAGQSQRSIILRDLAPIADEAMRSTGAKGLAIALIEDGQVRAVGAYGARNIKGDPLNPTTVMYGASLTKAVFAYTVMQLVDEGKVDLDRPIAEMLPRPLPEYGNLDAYGNWGDLAGDERWRKLTPRILLTHSSGFSNFNWDEPDGKLRFNFGPGARYAYSGEGIILLQFALEVWASSSARKCSAACSTASE